jgi:hypothetical protein
LVSFPSPTNAKNNITTYTLKKKFKRKTRKEKINEKRKKLERGKKKKTKKLLKVGLVVEKEIEKRFSPPSTQKRNGGKNTNIEQNKVKLKKTIRVHKQGGDKEH